MAHGMDEGCVDVVFAAHDICLFRELAFALESLVWIRVDLRCACCCVSFTDLLSAINLTSGRPCQNPLKVSSIARNMDASSFALKGAGSHRINISTFYPVPTM